MKTKLFWGATIVLGLVAHAKAEVIYVDDDAFSSGSGMSWTDPMRRLQDALEIVGPETTEIRIAGGDYRPDESDFGLVQPLDRSASFVIPGNVIVRGGYAGLQNQSDPDLHDPDQFPTTLSGDLLGNDMAFNDATKMDNSHRILSAGTAGFVQIEDLVIRQAFSTLEAPAAHIGGGSGVTLRNVTITNNQTAQANTFRITSLETIRLEDCNVSHNVALASAGGFIPTCSSLAIIGCDFRYNTAEVVAGLSFGSGFGEIENVTIVNSTFVGNQSQLAGGGLVFGLDNQPFIENCLIAKNSASFGAGILGTTSLVRNCVFVENQGDAIHDGNGHFSENWDLSNCIVRDNSPTHFTSLVNTFDVQYSCIEGGWESGFANIDADPMFVQPGTDNYRLSHNSPCLNAGLNGALPADTLDLDSDGNTTEPLPIDLAGAARIQDAIVDMGAYEGSFDSLPPADQTESLDQGEFIILVPSGEPFAPGEVSAMFVYNIAGGDDAVVTVTDLSGQSSGLAGGLPEDVALMSLETTLADGTFLATLIQPFDALSLGATEGTSARPTAYDELTDEWLLAPARNHANSPGYSEPIGDLIISSTIAGWSPTNQPGDYGAVWEETLLKGFAWAHVDRPGEYGLRFGDCPSDCAPPGGNGAIDINDMLFVLQNFGPDDHRWCDLDFNDVVDGEDMGHVFEDWGGCP